jgi:hypothetical protein
MAYLIPNTTPAERARGCSFGELFKSQDKVELNGGTVFGTPTIDFGIDLNGVDEYVKNKHLDIGTDDYSIICRCYPTGATDDFFSIIDIGASPNRVSLFIGNKNKIYSHIGNSFREDATTTTVPRNQIATIGISVDRSGNMSFYLNGVKTYSSDVSSLSTAALEGTLVIGARNDGADHFWAGGLQDLKVFKGTVLSAAEHDAYHNNSTYNYRNQAVLDLPMRAEQHEATRTLDVSGNGNHAVFGAGAATPTKLAKRGYKSDTNDIIKVSDCATCRPGGSFSIAVLCRGFTPGNRVIFESGDGNAAFSLQQFINDNFSFSVGGGYYESATHGLALDGTARTVIAVYESADKTVSIYISGKDDTGPLVVPIADPIYTNGGINILSRNGAFGWSGDLYQSMLFARALTPIQAADLHGKMMRRINLV